MIYLDSLGINFLILELKENLENAFVSKIYQYDENSFSIFFKKRQLFFQIKDKDSIVYIKEKKEENLSFSSNFLLSIKKNLLSSKLINIQSINNDRIIQFSFAKLNLEAKEEIYHLVFELMDRHSNIFLLNNNFEIINTLKNSTSIENKRTYFIGSKYEAFKSNKENLNFEKIYEDENDMLENIFGIGKIFALDCYNNIELRKEYSTKYIPYIFKMDNKVCLTYNSFSYFKDYEKFKFSSLNEALNEYFEKFTVNSNVFNKKNALIKHILNLIKKNDKIIKNIQKDIQSNRNHEDLRKKADIFASNLYLIKDNIDKVTLKDYETNEDILINLDIKKNRKENLNLLYQRYKKSKKAFEFANTRLLEILDKKLYLEESLEFVNKENDILGLIEIENQFNLNKSKKKENKKRELLKYVFNDFEIYVGRNSKENNMLTFEKAKAHDLWFHAKDVPGSHVIVVTNKKEVPNDVILEAAKLAAHHSKGIGKKTVDYTQKANVKRKNSFAQVNYVNFKTVIIKD